MTESGLRCIDVERRRQDLLDERQELRSELWVVGRRLQALEELLDDLDGGDG